MGDVDETFRLRRSIQLAAADQKTLLRSAAKIRREAEHEVAAERIVELARRAQKQLHTALGRELEEALERYDATAPEDASCTDR